MRKILVSAAAVTVMVLVVGSPPAQVPDLRGSVPGRAPEPAARATTNVIPRRIELPNIKALTAKLLRADRSVAQRQLVASRHVVAFWENPAHTWLRAPNQDKCWDVPWQRSCTIARASYRLHLTLAVAAQQKLWREFPLTNDWVTAVRIAQRVYPGTASWLLAISDREGGWGEWVWWSGACGSPPCHWQGYHVGSDATGDTVGGPLQFRFSTFAPYWRAAQADLRRRGYIIPEIPMPPAGGDPRYAGWLSMLGQALTGGYMKYYGKEGCHWCL